jgi:hypothetical protein
VNSELRTCRLAGAGGSELRTWLRLEAHRFAHASASRSVRLLRCQPADLATISPFAVRSPPRILDSLHFGGQNSALVSLLSPSLTFSFLSQSLTQVTQLLKSSDLLFCVKLIEIGHISTCGSDFTS